MACLASSTVSAVSTYNAIVDEFCYRYNLRNANPFAAFNRTINLGLGGSGISSDFPLKVTAGTADRPLIIKAGMGGMSNFDEQPAQRTPRYPLD